MYIFKEQNINMTKTWVFLGIELLFTHCNLAILSPTLRCAGPRRLVTHVRVDGLYNRVLEVPPKPPKVTPFKDISLAHKADDSLKSMSYRELQLNIQILELRIFPRSLR